MVVEPIAGDRLEDNLNPVGRLYYAGSTMICVPTSLAQEVGAARAGRDFDSTGVVLGAVTVVDEDGPAARERARSAVAMYFEVVAGLDPTVAVPHGWQ